MVSRYGARPAFGSEPSRGPAQPAPATPSADQIAVYIEDMLGELAKLAASAGRYSLASALRSAAAEASRSGERRPAP